MVDDDYFPEPQACSDPSMIMSEDEVFAEMCKRPRAVRHFAKCCFDAGEERGREEAAAVAFGIIALGTWAQNVEIERWKARDRNVRLTYKCPECSSRIGGTKACETCMRYYYGRGEFDTTHPPRCPTCET